MELTPEEKQRIEEEERKKLAEEQYRAEVRAELQASVAPLASSDTSSAKGSKKVKDHLWVPTVVGLTIIGLLAISWLLNSRLGSKSDSDSLKGRTAGTFSTPSIRHVPVSQKIAAGQIVVRSGGYVQYRIRIEPEMRDAHVSGSFNVGGGSGNDIEAVIADENEFLNWINGHQAKAYYGTTGKKTTGHFDVRLGPGTYVLAFSNKFSLLSDKYVFLEVDLNYTRLETY